MRLAEYTDYTLRVLMYCAARPQQLVTISELAERHGVSRNHLMKIVTDLGRQGVLETTRGRGGGLRLLKDPARIRIGDVVRASETDFRLVECFDPQTSRCTLTPSCRLKGVFDAALREGIRVAPGVLFSNSERFDRFLRISCGYPFSPQIDAALTRLGEIVGNV
mgnify:CR=1 FL=1